MPNKNIILKQILILLALSYFFLMFGNGILSLTNPDEVFYTQAAKEMAQKNSWMTPYLFGQPQFEKPILLYWLMRAGFLVFGINSFSARFFPALFAILGVIAVYLLALAGFKDEKKAFLAGLVAMSYGLYIGLARSVFTDMIFSMLILFSLVSFFWAYTEKKYKRRGILLFFLFAALAVLAKGPLGFLIPLAVIFIFLLLRRDIKYLFCADFLLGWVIFLAVSLPWYILMVKKYGATFTYEFFYNDHWRRLIEAEHLSNDTWYFYPLSMIGCMFPWSVYVAAGLIYLFRRLKRNASPMHLFLASWIIITLLAFQFAHSKLVSYIFPLFPALAIIVADFIYDFNANKNGAPRALDRGFMERNTEVPPLAGRMYKLALRVVSLATFFIILAIPVGLWISSRAYSVYIPSKLAVYLLAFLLLALAGIFLAFSLKDKFIKSVYTLMLVIFLFIFFLPFVAQYAEPYISSKTACDYLLKNYDLKGTLLCSKFFARGVHYYTEREVAVIDINGKNYFSPHPIPFFSSMDAVNDFLRAQGITYGIMKKSGWVWIKALPEKEFKCTLLESIGDAYLVKIEARKR